MGNFLRSIIFVLWTLHDFAIFLQRGPGGNVLVQAVGR